MAISKKVTEDQSMGGVYMYTDSKVAVMNATNMLILVDALKIECKSVLKTKSFKLAWLKLWSLFGESVLEP